jgi:cytidine deaminase
MRKSVDGMSLSKDDWETLHQEAIKVMARAYAPYSQFKVGVAAIVDDGRIVTGCNVENASYGVGLCAECGLVSDLAASGGGRLIALTCVDGEGNLLQPCGRCRQLLFEFGGNDLLISTPEGPKALSYLLPWAFGPDNLESK